jgi:CBS-domain-containing membrane protein
MPQTPGVPDHAAPRGPLMARVRKAVTAACGLAATLVAAGVLDDTAEAIVTGALALATVLGVYAFPNSPAAQPVRITNP